MMSEECNHVCSECEADCESRTQQPESFLEKPHELSNVKHVVGVVSGKGVVGRSLVTAMMAVEMSRQGYTVGILDADITGPSIPKIFGVHTRAAGTEMGIYPVLSKTGIRLMSLNLLLDSDTEPVIWRGPIIANVVKQFWSDVMWGDIDYLFVDMPPGTGDVPLTVFQSLPVDGILVVTSPQDLVSMIVEKAVRMAEQMNIPILGIVENMSGLICPDCGKYISVFGESHIEEIAGQHGIKAVDRLPIDPKLATLCDEGRLEEKETDMLSVCREALENL